MPFRTAASKGTAIKMPAPLTLPSTSIADNAKWAHQLLETCQVGFRDEAGRIAESQLSRLKLWASNIGVFASRHACLDYRLRTAPTARNAVEGTLELLSTQLLTGEKYIIDIPKARFNKLWLTVSASVVRQR